MFHLFFLLLAHLAKMTMKKLFHNLKPGWKTRMLSIDLMMLMTIVQLGQDSNFELLLLEG